MSCYDLNAEPRSAFGSNTAKKMRRENWSPPRSTDRENPICI